MQANLNALISNAAKTLKTILHYWEMPMLVQSNLEITAA
jgi:hypothetical protein